MRAGRVTVEGRVAQLGDSADPEQQEIRVDGRPVRTAERIYWMLHKPKGVVTTRHDPEGRPCVMDLLPAEVRRSLLPVGRLDRETEGLLLMTNDGDAAQRLLHPSFASEREYSVTVKGKLDARSAARLAAGIRLSDGRTAPADVGPRRYDATREITRFRLTLREGRKRQIRRSLATLRYPVVRLIRVRVGPLRLGRLAVGRARALSQAERRTLLRHVRALRAVEPSSPAGKPSMQPAKRTRKSRRSRRETVGHRRRSD